MERRLAAILAADVVGYSRLMETDEVGTLTALKLRRRDVLEPLVAKHLGRIFKTTGDGVLVEFGSAGGIADGRGLAAVLVLGGAGRANPLKVGSMIGKKPRARTLRGQEVCCGHGAFTALPALDGMKHLSTL